METIMKNDLYIDHETHDTFIDNCSSCFAENLILKSGRACPSNKCKGNGINLGEATYCDACTKHAESFDIGI